jgi:FdhD protein
METFTIIKIRQDGRETIEDIVTPEVPFTLKVNTEELVTLLCSPSDLEDLARGFLFTSGLIKKGPDIKEILVNKQHWLAHIEIVDTIGKELTFKRLYTSGCGKGTLFYNAVDIMYRSKIISDFKIKSNVILALMADFQKKSESYLKTGGVHSAALANKDNILVFREDIGRHNAIDKVIGNALIKKLSFENLILMTSGRISSEVLLKVRKCCIPVVISRSAPTNQAVRHARQMDITLIGFARGTRMNVYSAEERVI